MHHRDNRMDVTTATRFHLGEHTFASILRLGLIPLLGIANRRLRLALDKQVAAAQTHTQEGLS